MNNINKILNYGLLSELAYLTLESDFYKKKFKNIYTNNAMNTYLMSMEKEIETLLNNQDIIKKEDRIWLDSLSLKPKNVYEYLGIREDRVDTMLSLLNKFELIDFTSDDGYLNSDFQAMLFKDGSKYIIAFRGTASFKDILADALISANKNFQKNEAIDFVKNMMNKYKFSNDDLTLTGHSLGGIISQEVAAQLKLKAYSYNPLGSSKLITGNSSIIQSAIEYLNLDKYQSKNFKDKVNWAKKYIFHIL